MTYKTHFNFGILLSLLIINIEYRSSLEYIIFLILTGIVALIPDFDHKNSYISNRINPVLCILLLIYIMIYFNITSLIILIFWIIVTYFSKHRTFSHSLFGLLIFILPFIGVKILYPVFIGYVSHLFADLLTEYGIPLFYPFSKKRIRICKITTNSLLEQIILIFILIINIILIIKNLLFLYI